MLLLGLWDKGNQRVVQMIISHLGIYENRTTAQVEKIQYSLSCVVGELGKLILLIGIFALQNRLTWFCVSYTTLVAMRIFLGGSHRKTTLGCFLQAVITFEIIAIVDSLVPLVTVSQYVIWLLTIVWIWRYAPIVSEKRCHYSIARCMRFKAMALTTLTIIISFINVVPQMYANCMSWTIAIQLLEAGLVIWSRKRKEVYANEQMEGESK